MGQYHEAQSKNWSFNFIIGTIHSGYCCFSLLFALTAGSMGSEGRSFIADIFIGQVVPHCYMPCCRVLIFNLSNVLLVTVIDFCRYGHCISDRSWPGVGPRSHHGYVSNPVGNPLLIFTGLASVVLAIILDGIAYSKIPSDGKNQ